MVCVLPLQWMTKVSEWEDPDQNKLWSALLRNTWLIIGCGSLISVQTKSTLNRNECWELWAYLKVLNPRGRVGFKTTLKLQCGELSQLCMQAALPSIWTHLGQGSFVTLRLQSWWTENAVAINWIASLSPLPLLYWGIWQGCKTDLPAWCQGSFTLTSKGSLGSVSSSHHPSIFFKWTEGGLRSSCSAVSTGVLTIHGSEALQHFGQTGGNKNWACLLRQEFWSPPHWSFGAWCAGITTRATDKQAVSNADT